MIVGGPPSPGAIVVEAIIQEQTNKQTDGWTNGN
jgi:hypothetical protein